GRVLYQAAQTILEARRARATRCGCAATGRAQAALLITRRVERPRCAQTARRSDAAGPANAPEAACRARTRGAGAVPDARTRAAAQAAQRTGDVRRQRVFDRNDFRFVIERDRHVDLINQLEHALHVGCVIAD